MSPPRARYGLQLGSQALSSTLVDSISRPRNGEATRTPHSRLSSPQETVAPAQALGWRRSYELKLGQVRATRAGRCASVAGDELTARLREEPLAGRGVVHEVALPVARPEAEVDVRPRADTLRERFRVRTSR